MGDFLKVFLGLPFAFFPKMRVLGDLPKIAITWPFGHLWSRCLLLNLFQFLVFKCILIIGYCHLRHSAFWRFQRGHPFGRFLKNFPWSPFCTFSEDAGFGSPCENRNNLAIRALLKPLFLPQNLLQSLPLKCILIRGLCHLC